jgi:hypothetical protein
MDKNAYGNRGQVDSWFNGAPPEDTIHGTIAGLRRLAQLPQEARDRFIQEVGQDQTAQRVLDELKTTA